MKKKMIPVILLSLALAGCTSNTSDPEAGGYEDTSSPAAGSYEDMSDAEKLQALLEEDEDNDRKAVYWDGTDSSSEEDEEDDPEISDGRSGPGTYQTYLAEQLIECIYPEEYEQINQDPDQPDSCHFVKGDTEIFVSPISYTEEKAGLEEDENYVETDSFRPSENATKYFENYATFVGIREIDGVKKAGFVLILESNLAQRSYKIETYGLGNMTEIAMAEVFVVNGFDVKFY